MLVLIGFMGAGKTTVGRTLAAELAVPFHDSDLVIEARQGRAVAEIFTAEGEPVFRELEHATILELIAGPDAVIAVGGGAMADERTRHALAAAATPVAYLRVGYEQALGRVSSDPGRPMLHRPGLDQLYRGRLPLYEEVATLIIDTDGLTPAAVATQLRLALAEQETANEGETADQQDDQARR